MEGPVENDFLQPYSVRVLVQSTFNVLNVVAGIRQAYVKCVPLAYISGSELTGQFGKLFIQIHRVEILVGQE